MSSYLESKSYPLERRQIAQLLVTLGWSGFWIQFVLTAISILILGFALLDPGFNLNLKSGVGLLSVIGGVSVLGFSIYWFFHYVRFAERLEVSEPSLHPNRKETIQILHLGVLLNLAAMLLTLVGIEAVIGGLLLKTLSVPQGAAVYRTGQLIELIDIFVVQANVSMIVAQFVGIVIPFWLVSRVENHQEKVASAI